MKSENKLFAAIRTENILLIALGIIIAGLFVKMGLNSIANKDRIVSVRGLAEKIVPANKATWNLSYSINGNNLNELYNIAEQKDKEIYKFLVDNGIKKDEIFQTEDPSITDNYRSSYVDEAKIKYRYVLSSSITVISPDVEKVQNVSRKKTELIKSGILLNSGYEASPDYEFTKLNEVKPEMIEEATKNAREAANKFANDSKAKVGKIVRASQGQFEILSADPYTNPHLKKIRVVIRIDYKLVD